MKTPTQSLIHQRLNCFVNFIAPEQDEDLRIKEHFRQIKARIEKHAKEEGYTIASVHYAGSYSKRTGLKRHLTGGSEVEGQDIDIAFVLEDSDRKGQPIQHSLIPDFKRYLEKQWPRHLIDHTKSSATLSLSKQQLRFDLIPLLKTEQSNIQKLIRINREERTTSVQGHTEFIKQLNQQGKHIHFNNGLRLVKWWRYHQQSKSKIFANRRNSNKVPSFLLDLLCAKAYQETPSPQSYPEMLYNWFNYLYQASIQLEAIHFMKSPPDTKGGTTLWQVIDPIDECNNVVQKWQLFQIKELAKWFQSGRDSMIQAIHFDSMVKDDESLNCLKNLFGASIKTHCK